MSTGSRRRFLRGGLALAGVGLLTGCGVMQSAAPSRRIGRIGYLNPSVNAEAAEAFLGGLRDLGYIEGQNVVIEWRSADGRIERLPELAAELVGLRPDAIVALSDPAVQALTWATQTIPIVTTVVGDPIGNGWVASLSQPGGNVTGLTVISPELSAKRLELLKQVVPGLSRVVVVRVPTNVTHPVLWRETEQAAALLGLSVSPVEMTGPGDFERVFEDAARDRADAVVVLPEPVHNSAPNRARFVALAAQHRLPTIYAFRELAEAGGLLVYGPSTSDLTRRGAAYVDKILKGARPGELPMERPTRFDLIISLQTARGLGLTIPPSVLAQATEIIE